MKMKALCALLVPVILAGGVAAGIHTGNSSRSLPSPSLRQVAVIALATAAASALPAHEAPAPIAAGPAESIDLQTAVGQGILQADFKGNGREKLRAILTNKTGAPLSVKVSAGQMLENDRNTVIVTRAGEVELRPGKATEVAIQTAATRSANKIGDAALRLSYGTMPRLDALLGYAQDHPELSAGALQTAVLALTENLPVSAVTKFTSASGDLPSRFDTSAFRVETFDVVAALTVLRELGTKESDLAMTIDPQLKIEAMIDPLTRANAMRYYGITADAEWAFWKNELLAGETTTRHYALYGIARFYPEVAIEMLPKWAREAKTGAIFRLSAVQALADTQRSEALPILRQFVDEFGRDSELGRAAIGAATYLDAHLAKMAASRTAVAFR